jgi:glc operon protein GlcG
LQIFNVEEHFMSNLTTFKQESISISAAQQAIAAGITVASAMNIPMSIVIVDATGHVVALARMDHASPLSSDVAFKKAWTAAVTNAPTSGVHQFIASDAGSLLSMPHVANFTVVSGGLPIAGQGGCVGGIGVSGATAELDTKVAEAVAAALS